MLVVSNLPLHASHAEMQMITKRRNMYISMLGSDKRQNVHRDLTEIISYVEFVACRLLGQSYIAASLI